jgi:uncharacterized cupredoxin-like copper-binding protein
MKAAALALLLLCAGSLPAPAATDWSQATTVNVVTTEYKFVPATLSVEQGRPYHLHLENHGNEQHEFTAPEFFKTLKMRDTTALNADKTEIELPPGTTKDLFFVPGKAGKFPLRCSDHDWAGMVGQIVVQAASR